LWTGGSPPPPITVIIINFPSRPVRETPDIFSFLYFSILGLTRRSSSQSHFQKHVEPFLFCLFALL
jgi:hypothetical protein